MSTGCRPRTDPRSKRSCAGVEFDPQAQIRPSGPGDDGDPRQRRLTIQNDIGETDAHVVVIAVEARCGDGHLHRRASGAREVLHPPVRGISPWNGAGSIARAPTGLGDDGVFYLVTGRCRGRDDTRRDAFLEAIGASLVFLIDWNKARKVLRDWVSKGDAVQILDRAARHRFGHRGFLELGGGELVAAAVHHAAPARIGFRRAARSRARA